MKKKTRCYQTYILISRESTSNALLLKVPYLSAALGVRVTLQDVSHHGSVTFLHCPVEGSLSILKWKRQGKY